MRTIALRFSENFAPSIGTIRAHMDVLETYGKVWYGKLGNPISEKIASAILELENPQILLIHSGKQERYWAKIDAIQRDTPKLSLIPSYYRHKANDFSCWFRVLEFTSAPKNVLSACTVVSSGNPLSQASRHSMSPYFIIDYMGEENE